MVGREFKLLAQRVPYLLAATRKDRMDFFFDEETSDKADEYLTRVFGDIKVMVERTLVFGKAGFGA